MPRDNFSQKVKETLAKRVGMRCSNPSCHQLTSGPHEEPEKSVNVGVAAHIKAASENGPRFDPLQTSKERSSIENAIWLCQTCAKLVDNDPLHYPVELLHQWKRDAEAQARGEVEGSVAGNDDEDESITRYLEVVRQDHGRLLPLFERGAESELLEKVYVSLALQPDQGKGEMLREIRPHRPMSLSELLKLDPSEHSWVTRRWVVRGDPGSGKTTLLRHLASKLAGADEPRWIPIFFSLPRLVREGCSVLAMLESRLKRGGIDSQTEPFDELGKSGRLLVLLDGLDEVPSEKREDVEELLLGAMQAWPETPIVVSTRPIGYNRPHSAFREVDVQPLDRDKQLEFLARRLRGESDVPNVEKAREALVTLDGDPTLSDLARNPLYLMLMSLLIEQGKVLEGNRTQLYDDIFDLLLSGQHRRRRQTEKIKGIDRPEFVRLALQHLAYEMSQQNRDTATCEDLEEQLEEDESIVRKLHKVRGWRDNLPAFFDDVGELTGILGPHDGQHEDWRYWHRTFREALTAEKLEALCSDGEEQVLEHFKSVASAEDKEMDKGRWAETYALLAGRANAPDGLVLSLIEQDLDLGLRAFEGVQKLGEESLRQLLTHGNWRVRTAAQRRIPDLIATPERSLELIDELRQKTRNGNDLFFLDLALTRTSKCWALAKDDAERLRERFFDHIPQPPEDLFRWIETKDGRVELWREIPAGSFVMGSPEDEEGRLDREGPQQRVEIATPFQMACVPVIQEQFAAFDPEHESHHKGDRYPVENVTWFQAAIFCRWLSQAFPLAAGARLPSEEEWEYACRAGTTTRFWSGNDEKDLGRVGWYSKNSASRTHNVGKKDANPWGLYDVHGNVDEWMCSKWNEKPYVTQKTEFFIDSRSNPATLAASLSAPRVIQGGSYWFRAWDARAAYRGWLAPGDAFRNQGFRVLLPNSASVADH